MSQPTVSRRIDVLEHSLRLTLFTRDTRGLHPTQEALQLRQQAEAVEAAVLGFAKAAQQSATPNLRPIRLTAPRVNFSDNLAAVLAEFTDLNPGVHFELVASYEVLDLMAGEADVAIRVAHAITDDRLICRKLSDAATALYAARSYADRHGLPRSEAEFAGHKFVVFQPGTVPNKVNDWLLDRIDAAQIVSRCSDMDSMYAAVRAGIGIGPIPTGVAMDQPGFQRCFPPPAGQAVPVWLVIGPDAWRRPEVKAFAKFFAPRFVSYMRKGPDLADPGPEDAKPLR